MLRPVRCSKVFGALLLLVSAGGAHTALAQANIVIPQTAGQNQVRWDKFDWEYVDLLKGGDQGAGIRLYYYKNEKDTAERAAAAIIEEYQYLVEQFDYRPQVKIPYILYNSHGELEQTNVFQIPESTLGVTSPEDLRMTTAYWGDHSRFRHVSLHEMVHQFTIQKVNGVAERAKAYGSPLQKMPLWFVEGLAEYYSTPGGLDAETEEYVRDVVANPDPSRGYTMPQFLNDEQRSFIYTYKLGQARCYFLAETYGKAKLQEMLSTSYRLRGWRRMMSNDGTDTPTISQHRERVLEFDELLERVTGDTPQKVQAKWEDWLKRRYFKEYLAASQKYSDYREVEAARQYPDAFTISPDGNSMVYRGIEPITGTTRLYLCDPRDPISATVLVEDSRPGVDTLHYFDRPVAAIDKTRIAYVARDGSNDVLRLVDYRHSAHDAEEMNHIRTRAHFRVSGVRRTYDPAKEKIREMGSPAFSPDGKQIAFVGLDEDGVDDLWILDLASAKYSRITHDGYAEKEIDWGAKGIVFASDATETREYNLFLVQPDGTGLTRLTWASANHRYPRFSPDGGTVAYAGDDGNKWDIYLLSMNGTGAGDTAPAPTPTPSETGHTSALDGSLASTDSHPIASNDGWETADDADDPSAVALADGGKTDAAPVQKSPHVRATDFPTGLTYPAFTPTRMYALGLKSGKYRVFSIERASLESQPVDDGGARSYAAWKIPSENLDDPRDYSIMRTDSWQLEQAFATLGGSTGIYGSGFLLFNDKMRDRTVYVVANAYGRADLLDAQAVYLDRTNRVTWGTVAFVTPQPVLDPIYSSSLRTILFVERKYGAAGIVEYPFNRYLRVAGTLGLAGTDRFIPSFYDAPDFGYGFGGDATGKRAWERENAGVQPEIDTSVSFGFDTLALTYETGPISGNSVIATLSSYYQPTRNGAGLDQPASKYGSWFGDVQVDAEHYIRLYKTVNVGLRGAWGESFGDEWKRPFYVSSVDNLRGVPWYSFYLVSQKYVIGNAELQVPLDGLVRLLIFQNIEGIAAVDAGSLFNHYSQFNENKTAAFVTGFNFNLAIFQFRLHFAKSFDVGGLKPGEPRASDGQVIVPTGWVTNFTIRYLFF